MRNPFRRRIRHDVDEALMSLVSISRTPWAADYFKDMLVYAKYGRDRRKLDMAWVERVHVEMRKLNTQYEHMFRESQAP